MSVQHRLRAHRPPDEAQAEERSWRVVSAALTEQRPRARRRPLRSLLLAAAGAVIVAALAAGGAAVAGLFDGRDESGSVSAPRVLRLPASGRLLVQSESGPWVVQRDGSKRLLGRYDEAAWSPHGIFVVATRGRQLVALEPNGRVRWSITAPGPVRDARWSPSGFRIAYRSGSSLRVVAGDGTGDRELAAHVAPVAPAWRPGARHVLTFAGTDERLATMDADSGRVLSRRRLAATPTVVTWSADGRRLAAPEGARAAAFAPKGRALAVLRGGEVRVDGRRVFAAPGRLGELAWSPDARWLLVTLPDANQWLFVRPGAQRLVTASGVAQQFDPGATGAGAFPKVVGWAP